MRHFWPIKWLMIKYNSAICIFTAGQLRRGRESDKENDMSLQSRNNSHSNRRRGKKDPQRGNSQPLKAVKGVRPLMGCGPPTARTFPFPAGFWAVEIFKRE